jgi:hypothetical protein
MVSSERCSRHTHTTHIRHTYYTHKVHPPHTFCIHTTHTIHMLHKYYTRTTHIARSRGLLECFPDSSLLVHKGTLTHTTRTTPRTYTHIAHLLNTYNTHARGAHGTHLFGGRQACTRRVPRPTQPHKQQLAVRNSRSVQSNRR